MIIVFLNKGFLRAVKVKKKKKKGNDNTRKTLHFGFGEL